MGRMRERFTNKNQACCLAFFDDCLTTILATAFGFIFTIPVAFAAMFNLTRATAV